MLDGHRSGRSTGRMSCKGTELRHCSMIEMRWNEYAVSLASPVIIVIIMQHLTCHISVIRMTKRILILLFPHACYLQLDTFLQLSVCLYLSV